MSELLIQNLKFDESGLITAVVQDDDSDEILMVAHMNAESLAKTLQTGETWFWSRSRQELWHKGATSGATQRVVDLRLDCDGHKDGYDLELTRAVAEAVNIPVIASGGAGALEHLFDALTIGKAGAALAASIFHFGEFTIGEAKQYLRERGVLMR